MKNLPIEHEALFAAAFDNECIVGDYEGNSCKFCTSFTTDTDIHCVCDADCLSVRALVRLQELYPGLDLNKEYFEFSEWQQDDHAVLRQIRWYEEEGRGGDHLIMLHKIAAARGLK